MKFICITSEVNYLLRADSFSVEAAGPDQADPLFGEVFGRVATSDWRKWHLASSANLPAKAKEAKTVLVVKVRRISRLRRSRSDNLSCLGYMQQERIALKGDY